MLTSSQKHFFFIQIPVILSAIIAAVFFPAQVFDPVNLLMIVLAYFLIFGFGIEVGYHRFFSHRAFELKWPWLEYVIAYLGLFGLSQAPFGWVLVHRQHHRYSDTEKDIHSPVNGGFWYSFIFWNTQVQDSDIVIKKNELAKSKFHVWLHKNYFWFMIANLITLLALFPTFTFFTLFPAFVLSFTSTALGGALSHLENFGYKNFDLDDKSNNILWFGIWSFGLGYQNNHHKYPNALTSKVKWFEFDPGYYIVKLIAK